MEVSYLPAAGSSERAAFDRLEEDERLVVEHWLDARAGVYDSGVAVEEMRPFPDERRSLMLQALGYGRLAANGLAGVQS